MDSSGSGYATMAGSREHGNESSPSINYGLFIVSLSDCQHLKEDWHDIS
jgi:hypothetical protein